MERDDMHSDTDRLKIKQQMELEGINKSYRNLETLAKQEMHTVLEHEDEDHEIKTNSQFES